MGKENRLEMRMATKWKKLKKRTMEKKMVMPIITMTLDQSLRMAEWKSLYLES